MSQSVPPTPKAALLVNRIIWAALLIGQFAFMGVEAVLFSQEKQPQTPVSPVLLMLNIAMLVTVVPMMMFIRTMIFQKARRGQMPAVQAFSTGNILVLAGCEAPSFFGLVINILHHGFGVSMIVVAIAIAIQVVNFPKQSVLDSLKPGLPFA